MLVGKNPQKLYSTASLRVNSSMKQGMLVGKNPQNYAVGTAHIESIVHQSKECLWEKIRINHTVQLHFESIVQ